MFFKRILLVKKRRLVQRKCVQEVDIKRNRNVRNGTKRTMRKTRGKIYSKIANSQQKFVYVLGAQTNHLIETVILGTQSICFGLEIRKVVFFGTHS